MKEKKTLDQRQSLYLLCLYYNTVKFFASHIPACSDHGVEAQGRSSGSELRVSPDTTPLGPSSVSLA